MTGWRLPAAACVGVTIACAAFFQSARREVRMSEIQLAAMPASERVLAGESLTVRAIVSNAGAHAEPIPAPMDRSPYSYELASEAPEGPRYVVSQAHMAITLAGDPSSPRTPAPPHSLASGSRIAREEDVAMLSGAPFLPGAYTLTALWNRGGEAIRSFPAPVEIEIPNPAAFVSATSRRLLTIPSVLAHVEPSGAVVLLQRESFAGKPAFGVYYRRARLEPPARLQDVSVALDAQAGGGGRWAAWLQDGAIAAMKGFGETVLRTAAPVATGLREVRFAGPGVQLGPGAALFVVAGMSEGGARLQQYSLSAAGLKKPWEAELGATVPSKILSRFGPRGVDEVWADGATLWIRSFDWRGGGKPARVLAELPVPIQAWELDPAGGKAVYALAGPAEGRMHYRRVPIDDGIEPLSFEFPAPEDGTDAWAVCASDEGGFPVLARSAGAILVRRAASGAWSTLAVNAAAFRFLQLLTLDGSAFWAHWFDPERGFHLQEIR
jgi:hypothetical protein